MTARLKCACEFGEILCFNEILNQLCKVQGTIFSPLFRPCTSKDCSKLPRIFFGTIGLSLYFNLLSITSIRSSLFLKKKIKRKERQGKKRETEWDKNRGRNIKIIKNGEKEEGTGGTEGHNEVVKKVE